VAEVVLEPDSGGAAGGDSDGAASGKQLITQDHPIDYCAGLMVGG